MSDLPEEIGVVVIGLGIAGGVRVRDLKEKSCGLTLQGVISRRPVTLPDVTSLTLDDALARKDVGAVIICTENKTHEEFVRLGLENGKHVLVEYPVALSSSNARELYNLADQKGLVLWQENIALLSENHQKVKAKAAAVGIKSATISVTGNYNGWTEKFDESGLPFTSGVTSLENVMDLFGDLTVVSGKLEQTEHAYTATACLQTQTGAPITITLGRKQSKERSRKKSGIYEFLDGEVIDLDKLPVKPPSKPGLFLKDMHNYYQAVLNGKNDKAAQQRTIKCLEMAEKIHAFFTTDSANL